MKVFFAESEWWEPFSEGFQEKFESAISDAHDEVAKMLKNLPEHVNYFVQVAPWNTIPEVGLGGRAVNSRLLLISLDHGLPYGEEALYKSVRETAFHELNHAARYEGGYDHWGFLSFCVMEGLATVFERDKGGSDAGWGKYDEKDTKVWLEEIRSQGDKIDRNEYMYRHSDGRRWIGYKVGTWIVDEAIKKSGRDIVDLTDNATSEEILELAQV